MRLVSTGLRPRSLLPALVLIVLMAVPLAAKPLSEGGFLGVYTRELDIALLEALGFDGDGVLIEDVVSASPAEEAGIEPGDILTTLNDHTITSPRTLKRALWRTEPGEEVTVGLWRKGKDRTVEVALAEDTQADANVWLWNEEGPGGVLKGHGYKFFTDDDSLDLEMERPGYLGVNLQTLGDQLADYFKAGDNRVLIESVGDDSPAEKAGLKAGDVVLKIDGEEIEEVDDLVSLIRSHKKDDVVKITVLRNGKKKTLKATLDENEDLFWYGKVGMKHLRDLARKVKIHELPKVDVRIHEGKGGHGFLFEGGAQ
jgi:C-terminal processing protease CtpA/Prc